jgi:hypothetical protein
LRQLDPETVQGLAIPAYEQTLRIAEAQPERQFYKDAGTSAAIQLAIYYINVKKDREKSLAYTDRGLKISPADESLLSIKNQLTPKTAPKTEIKQKLESDKSKTKVKNGK